MKPSRLFLALFVAAILTASVFLVGGRMHTTAVAAIQTDARRYEGQSVTISGEVTGRFSVPGFRTFTVRDETGEIHVISSRPAPAPGARLRVRGRIHEGFALGPIQVLVLIEQP